jgi:P-type Mg2+ transporter
MLMGFMMVMVPIVLIISGFVSKDWGSAALFCISVAVGITPEMLPMILNANLCRGALKLAKLKVVVKKLDAVQSLGAMDILCSDKTGTLTKDDITLHGAVDSNNRPSDQVFQYAYLNATNQEGLRNSIDAAIVQHGHTLYGDEIEKLSQMYVKIGEIAFDFERRLLSVIVRDSSSNAIMITKGAVEEVLRKCTHLSRDGITPMTKAEEVKLMELCTLFNEQGSRVMGVASRKVNETDIEDLKRESGLTFGGFLTFLDPPKEDASQAIQDLQKARVGVKVLTGDSAAAARTAAIKIGLLTSDDSEKVISGTELALLSDTALEEAAERCVVFAKLKPLQKLEVVSALRRKGHAVGFLGDGINDAPALRTADVGISVDTGTTIVKHAADIILLQKSLSHVVNGVQYGRITHANTMKYIKMVASSNFGNIFSVTVAAAWLPFVPMAPLQLLVQNLLYDFSQAAIPWDHVDPEMTETPATWRVWSIVRFIICFGPTSSIFDIVTFLLGWSDLKRSN